MGLESGTWVDDLVSTNPPGGDSKSQGDDHLRLIKNVLRNTFKRASKAFYLPSSVSKSANYTVLSTDDNLTFRCDTTSPFTLTLPSLSGGDAGWSIFVLKVSLDSNPVFLQPTSGNINGFSKVRRSEFGPPTHVLWTGSEWTATRPNGNPVGAVLPFHGTTLPRGHLWADGSAYNTTDYTELFLLTGLGLLPDYRGRAPFGKDNLGAGVAANRITSGGSGIAGTTLGAAGGTETHTLTTAQLAVHNHGVFDAGHIHGVTDPTHGHGTLGSSASDSGHGHGITDPQHSHGVSGGTQGGTTAGAVQGGGVSAPVTNAAISINSASTGVTVNSGNANIALSLNINAGGTGISINNSSSGVSIANNGSGSAHQNMPPAMICNFVLVAE